MYEFLELLIYSLYSTSTEKSEKYISELISSSIWACLGLSHMWWWSIPAVLNLFHYMLWDYFRFLRLFSFFSHNSLSPSIIVIACHRLSVSLLIKSSNAPFTSWGFLIFSREQRRGNSALKSHHRRQQTCVSTAISSSSSSSSCLNSQQHLRREKKFIQFVILMSLKKVYML